ncbi:AraC family transcriptional regulator [Vallitalea pronyensis]|uniref:AraC family transcriptional regulator n=1 Tax=Vallitalea pronyensis TaxID=1348613 RepID=A0A8J8MMI2_9FIRM|nr:AraC family transcriptional regulator [Vallitalea pronyensis]QUI24485.1 AraC family transcriptional regulator [Vallitalea pronyensis]
MKRIRIPEGFHNQKHVVLPRIFIDEVRMHPLIQPLYITDIGFYPNAQYHFRERNGGCEQNILILCTKGCGWIDMHGRREHIEANTCCIIPKGIPHSYGTSDEHAWDIYWMHFDGYHASSFYETHMLTKNYFLTINEKQQRLLIDLFNTMYSALENGNSMDQMIYVCSVLNHFLCEIFFRYKKRMTSSNKQIEYIETAIEYMKENVENNITLHQLTKEMNLSKNHLIYLFKNKTGYTPIDYFIRLKMQRACQYLDLTNMTIAQVSKKMGYDDPYYFSRLFKKIMSTSPSYYRKNGKG